MLAVDVPRVLVLDRGRMLHSPMPSKLPTRTGAPADETFTSPHQSHDRFRRFMCPSPTNSLGKLNVKSWARDTDPSGNKARNPELAASRKTLPKRNCRNRDKYWKRTFVPRASFSPWHERNSRVLDRNLEEEPSVRFHRLQK